MTGTVDEPARRLVPDPQRDRGPRIALTVVAAAVIALVLLALAATSLVSWSLSRGYSEIPAVRALGAPSALTVETRSADVRLVHDDDADEVQVALVEGDATTMPPAGARVRAAVTTSGGADDVHVEVRQPHRGSPVPWLADPHDLLLVVPGDHDLALEVITDVGDVDLSGEYASLAVTSQVGAVDLTGITAPEGVTVRGQVGDVRLDLAGPAPGGVDVTTSVGDAAVGLAPDAGGDVTVETSVGSVTVRAPGSDRWDVETTSDVGEVQVDPGITGADGSSAGRITVASDVGDITVTR